MGPYGWLGLDCTAVKEDWGEVKELADAAYRLVAPRTAPKLFDGR
ncbi:hypothetical protein [Mycolicibacterium sp. P9-64]